MKSKIKIVIALLVASSVLIACGSKGSNEDTDSHKLTGSLTEIMESIQKEMDLDLMVMTETVDLNDADGLKYTLGLDSNEGIKDAVVSNAMITAQAFSLALVEVEANPNEVAKNIVNNVDPMKWICVGADSVEVGVYGNYILLVMVDTQLDMGSAKDYFTAFETVIDAKLDAIFTR